MKEKQLKRKRRRLKVRARVRGTKEQPRLSLYKSNRHLYAQLIDDNRAKTIVAASSRELKDSGEGMSMKEKASNLASAIAKKALAHKIHMVVFDRGERRYSGVTALFAESARKAGLKF